MSDSAVDIASVAPRWNAKEREIWLDQFSNFCGAIMGSTLEDTAGLSTYPEGQLKGDITLAADLADHALQEVQYRFNRNAHEAKQRAKRPGRR